MTAPRVRGSELLAEVEHLCAQILAAHRAGPDRRELIRAFAEAGLLDPALLDPAGGGTHGGSAELAGPEAPIPATAVIAAVAAAGADVPVVEHLWTAGHLLRTAGLTPPDGLLTAAFAADEADAAAASVRLERHGAEIVLSGSIPDVARIDAADHLVVLAADGTLAHLPVTALEIATTRSLGAQTWSTVSFAEVRVPAGSHVRTALTAADLRDRNAIGRLVQLRAAAERITRITTEHLGTRVQFGRELRRFQAAQHRLSACIGETIMLGVGADLALTGRPADIALARIDARRSVTVIREHSHQLHGAMGTTAEHPLGRLVATMLAYLSDTGPDCDWMELAHALIAERGPWATITGEEGRS